MIIEKFKAKEETVLTVFTRTNAPFYIPIYQRKYNWTFKDEIKDLIDDLRNFYNEAGDDKDSSYYLGNIVVKAKLNEITNEIKELVLIDGQQRLTTILLFINYLKFSLKDINDIDNNDKLEKINSLNSILYLYRGEDKTNRRLKILNSVSDNYLMKIFEMEGFETNDSSLAESVYFKNFIDISKELNITTKEEWEKWLNILKRVKIAQITLGNSDKEISVFESINSKGLPLNIIDLIKNYLFLISENSDLNEDSNKKINEIISNKLEPIFLKKDEASMNRFFAAFISKETIRDPAKDKKILYIEFKKWVSNELMDNTNKISSESFNSLMKNLENATQTYEELNKLGKKFKRESNILDYSKSYLAESKLEMYLTLFLILSDKINKNIISQEEERKIYQLLDIHNIALTITNRKNKDNRFLFKYIASVNGNVEYSSLVEFLTNNTENKSGMPTMEEFISSFKNRDIYNIDKKVAKYILYRIENFRKQESGEKIDFDYTVEHIFPINDKYWTEKFDSQEYKNSYIDSMGNLTLAKTKLNSKMSNNKFSVKVLEFKKSSLQINFDLIKSFKDWEIKEENNSPISRASELIEYIKLIWPIEIMNLVKINDGISEKDKFLMFEEKLTIANAIKFILFESFPYSKSLKEIEESLFELYDYIINSDFDIKINFSRDKISSGGWMTERLYSNYIENKNSNRFEKPLFEKEGSNWKITGETFKTFK